MRSALNTCPQGHHQPKSAGCGLRSCRNCDEHAGTPWGLVCEYPKGRHVPHATVITAPVRAHVAWTRVGEVVSALPATGTLVWFKALTPQQKFRSLRRLSGRTAITVRGGVA